jgi:hypothetical protein
VRSVARDYPGYPPGAFFRGLLHVRSGGRALAGSGHHQHGQNRCQDEVAPQRAGPDARQGPAGLRNMGAYGDWVPVGRLAAGWRPPSAFGRRETMGERSRKAGGGVQVRL